MESDCIHTTARTSIAKDRALRPNFRSPEVRFFPLSHLARCRDVFGKGPRFSLGDFMANTRRGIWAHGMPVIALGGIYGGVFSPVEAAAVACVYAVTRFVFRELQLSEDQVARNSAGRDEVFQLWGALGLIMRSRQCVSVS